MRVLKGIGILIVSTILWIVFRVVDLVIFILNIPKGFLTILTKMLSYFKVAVEEVVYNNIKNGKK